MHSAFALPIEHKGFNQFLELSAKTLKRYRDANKNVHTILIDEISMVSAKYLRYIHKRLCSITSNDDYFGGLNMILVGDFFQLRPCKGFYAFEEKTLWKLFQPFFLETNMRQKDDLTFTNLLNRARVGLLTKEDERLLKIRLIKGVEDEKFSNAVHIYPTRKKVAAEK